MFLYPQLRVNENKTPALDRLIRYNGINEV